MDNQSATAFRKLVLELQSAYHVPYSNVSFLLHYADSVSRSELEDRYSSPMLWIGLYIALASLGCIGAMVADLLHGFRRRRLWFPCKYFGINAVSLTVISVAMKLPVDLSGSMLGKVDQVAKFGSMAFLCTMMANLLPCIATMDSNELLSNVTALGVLVITVVVNVCIQIQTGVVPNHKDDTSGVYNYIEAVALKANNTELAIIYVTLLLVLLVIYVCSSLALLKSKEIIETKYGFGDARASEYIIPSRGRLLTFETLEKHVLNHSIMVATGNPQFIIACSPTASASGVICLFVAILHSLTLIGAMEDILAKDYESDYKWSMMVILIVQSIGVVVGAIGPVSRCFASLSFKVSLKIISNHFKVFKVESYWKSKLYEWKDGGVHEFRSHNLEVVIEKLKRQICNFCIGFQLGVVVMCKVIALFPFLFMLCVLHCLLKATNSSLGKKLEGNNDLRPYVLKLEDEMELGEGTLDGLSKGVNKLIQKSARNQPNNLMKLTLEKSTSGFQGVKMFDIIDDDNVRYPVAYQHCWKLTVVTLTTIAVSLPTVGKTEVDCLLESVREGLKYVTIVEKNLNVTDSYVSFQKATETLWREIMFDKKWLGNKLQEHDSQAKRAREIVQQLRDKAKEIAYTNTMNITYGCGKKVDQISSYMCAMSMSRITETILLTYHTSIDATVSEKELFDNISSMIADIIAACLTNLPQVITTKCYTKETKEREANVEDAAELLGETRCIIEALQSRNIPNMDPSDMPFIDKWRSYLANP